MNINIAFNTIIYIMVFLFPGILFRRAFFSGEFNKHFESGNSFERLLWNMLASVMMLASFCVFIHIFNTYSPLKVEFELGVPEVTDTFLCMYENKLPSIFASEERIIQTGNLLFSLYAFSLIFGFFINRIIFFLGLEKRFSILQFQNRWHYVTNSTKQNNLNHSIGDLYYTRVDVKSSKDELFTGKLHDILYDKEGKVEAITIKEAYRYNRLNLVDDAVKIADINRQFQENDPNVIFHSQTATSFIFRKRIAGDLFTILNNDLENISITYIKISNFHKKFQKFLKVLFSIMLLLAGLFSVSYAIWDFQLLVFDSYFKRLLFCIISPLNFAILLLLIVTIFNFKMARRDTKNYFSELKNTFIILILFSLPYLYIFNITRGSYMMLILILYLVLSSLILPKKNSDNTAANIH